MKNAFTKALKIFKYLFILFTFLYWIGVIIDDWTFIENYWETNWIDYLKIWSLYFLVFSLVFSFYYWIISSVIILVFHKIIKPMKEKKLATTKY